MDKKAAEEILRKAKEDTGRALFEKGGWEDSGDDDDEDAERWDLQQLRLETEQARAKREEDRLTRGWEGDGDGGGEEADDTPGAEDEAE